MKKNYILGGITLLLVVAYVTLFAVTYKSDNVKFKNEYEQLNANENTLSIKIPSDNPIKYISIDKVFDILENGTGIIYFGFPSCPWCRNIVPTLIDAAKSENQVIYYFNPQNIRELNDNNYNKLLKILDNYLDTDSEGVKKLFVPDVYFIKEGKIVGHHLGSLESQEDPRIPLTTIEQEELNTIFLDLITKIK